MGAIKVKHGDKCHNIYQTDGIYTVYDVGNYEIVYTSESDIKDISAHIEDYAISKIRLVDKRTLVIERAQLFIDSRGPVDITINNEVFCFDVLSNKMGYLEIEEMILYLYEKDNRLIESYYSRYKSNVNKSKQTEAEIPISAKYVEKICSIIRKYETLLPRFAQLPHTVIRRHSTMCDYGSLSKEYDINWLLTNLDLVEIDANLLDHPDAIIINDEYGWINKIKASESIISFDNYENEIILSGLFKIKYDVSTVKKQIETSIKKQVHKSIEYQSQSTEYYSFGDIKIIPLIKIEKELNNILRRTTSVLTQYQRLFKHYKVVQINTRLQFTPVFRYFPHYREIFKELDWLRKNKYNLNGIMDLVGLRSVSALYERYCYFQLNDILHNILLGDTILSGQIRHDGSRFICTEKELSIKLLLQPKIEFDYNQNSETQLVKVGNYEGDHYKPDYVLEIKKNSRARYIIIDAKYSHLSTVVKYHLNECSRKYLLDIGISGEEYQKPDYFIIINPEKDYDSNKLNIINTHYYPRIGITCVKPNERKDLERFIFEYIKKNID